MSMPTLSGGYGDHELLEGAVNLEGNLYFSEPRLEAEDTSVEICSSTILLEPFESDTSQLDLVVGLSIRLVWR